MSTDPEEEYTTPEAQRVLRRYLEMTHGDLSDTDRLVEYVFNAGWRAAVTAMVQFQDLPEQIRRIERRVHDLGVLVERHTQEEVS